MTFYELATLTFEPGVPPRISNPVNVEKYLEEDESQLVGCWRSEISRQNTILVLNRFDDLESLLDRRRRLIMSGDPFGSGANLATLSLETFVPFPGFEEVVLGAQGPYYEFRTYRVPVGGIAPTIAAWGEKVPERSQVSAPTIIMYALDGPTRFIHVWGYHTLAEREQIRKEALERNLWPPSSAPRWISSNMLSEVFVPTTFSPLQ